VKRKKRDYDEDSKIQFGKAASITVRKSIQFNDSKYPGCKASAGILYDFSPQRRPFFAEITFHENSETNLTYR
jgi:hypothetical protein